MALFERRSSMESFRDLTTQTPTSLGNQAKASFDPVGAWEPASPYATRPVGAFEVGKFKRICQIIIAVIYCVCAAGVVFGYAALKPVLIQEGVYRDQCTRRELDQDVWVCYGQDLRLNLMFTTAAVSTNVCALPVGAILDRFGPRVASCVGCLFLSIGALLMAFAAELPFDAEILGYVSLALGGPFVFIPSFHLSNTFPQNSGLILALLTGAFDSSSAVFWGLRLVYESSHQSFSLREFFLGYLIVPVLIFLAQIVIMPSRSYQTVGELVKQVDDHSQQDDDNFASVIEDEEERRELQASRRAHRENVVSEITALLGTSDGNNHVEEQRTKARKSGIWGVLHGKTAVQQILSPWWILIALFTIVQMTRINYFVATIRTQYTYMLHSYPKAVLINEVFDIALPIGGIISIPFVGLILDRTHAAFVIGLLVTLATVIGVFGVIPETWAAYANICLFVVYRPLYYTAISDCSSKAFGFETFGKVYGLIICLAGLFNFSQPALDALTHNVFNRNPIPVNIILLAVALIVGVALFGYVTKQSFTLHREQLELEAETATESLMPGANPEDVNQTHGSRTYGSVQ